VKKRGAIKKKLVKERSEQPRKAQEHMGEKGGGGVWEDSHGGWKEMGTPASGERFFSTPAQGAQLGNPVGETSGRKYPPGNAKRVKKGRSGAECKTFSSETRWRQNAKRGEKKPGGRKCIQNAGNSGPQKKKPA